MHKDFYASGFLYHSSSAKILLQNQNPGDPKAPWSMLGGIGKGKEPKGKDFQRVIRAILKLTVPLEAILPVYDYLHPEAHKKYHVFYAEVSKLIDFRSTKKVTFAWFSLKEISKLPLSSQTKQDLIVGQRVIDSQARRKAGERTIG